MRRPDADAQAAAEAAAARERWSQLQARLPLVRLRLAKLDGEWLPAMEAATAQAEADLAAARWRFLSRVVQQQGGEVVEVEGLPAVALDAGELEGDPVVAAASGRLAALRVGLGKLQTQRAQCLHDLAAAQFNAPPPPAD